MFFKCYWSTVDWWIGMSNRLNGSSTWSLGSLKCDSWTTCARQIELSRGVVQRTEPLLGSCAWWALGLGSIRLTDELVACELTSSRAELSLLLEHKPSSRVRFGMSWAHCLVSHKPKPNSDQMSTFFWKKLLFGQFLMVCDHLKKDHKRFNETVEVPNVLWIFFYSINTSFASPFFSQLNNLSTPSYSWQ